MYSNIEKTQNNSQKKLPNQTKIPNSKGSFSFSCLGERFKILFQNLSDHDIFILAGSFAYTTALALSPFLVIVLSLLVVLGPSSQQAIIEQLSSLIGQDGGEAIKMIAENAEKNSKFSGVSGFISFLIILISASAIFTQMNDAFDRINETKADEKESGLKVFLKEKVFSVGLVLGFTFLMIVSLFVTASLSLAFTSYEKTILLTILSIFLNIIIFSILFTCMFRFIPTEKMPWSRCLISGFSATIFFLIGKNLIGLYLGKSAVGSSYGAAGSLVVLLVWLYYTALTLFISFEFTKTFVLSEAKSNEIKTNGAS
ncbi:MAG: YihY/virulence factor BrkB family protein [Pseudobdellovibrio sp.]